MSQLKIAFNEGVAAALHRFKLARDYGVNIRPEGLAELAKLESPLAQAGGALRGMGSSALGFARRNPLMTAGALGVGALGLGSVLGSKHHEANESMPHQMLHRMGI